jgi:imidazolonepropionase-like amidohydrolase
LLWLFAASSPLTTADPATLALVGGRLVDGFGGDARPHAIVLVRGDRILAVGEVGRLAVPAAARVIDTEGRTILPGLVDAHAHLSYLGAGPGAEWPAPYRDDRTALMALAARQLLSAGVTTIRDPYCPLSDGLAVRRRIDAGEVPGPRLYLSGPALVGSQGKAFERPHGWGVGDAADARAKVLRLAEGGADLVKVLAADQMAPGVAEAIVDEARRRKIKTAFHGLRLPEVRRALAAGADVIEHLEMGTRTDYPPEVIETARDRNLRLFWVPTLMGFQAPVDAADDPERFDRSDARRLLPPEVWTALRRTLADIRSAEDTSDERRIVPTLAAKLRQLRGAGVTLVAGTDSGTAANLHTEALWREMWLWERAGVPPMEVIRAATYWPARLLGRRDIGVVEPGALADLVVVEGNPHESLRVLRDVHAVVKGGRVHVEGGRWLEGEP